MFLLCIQSMGLLIDQNTQKTHIGHEAEETDEIEAGVAGET